MDRRQLTPDLPLYEAGRRFLQIADGVRNSQYKQMTEDIYKHIRSPHNPVDWKDPEEWIPQKLTGKSRDLALRFWRESDHLVNPRHTFGPMYLCTIHELVVSHNDEICISEQGRKFIENDFKVLAKIDQYEGLLLVLSEVAAKGPGFRRDFLEDYRHFCRTRTTTISESTIKSSLSLRLTNLVQRNLIGRHGVSYEITDAGINYLQTPHINMEMTKSVTATRVGRTGRETNEYSSELANLIRQKNWAARQQLLEFLRTMNPFKLEHLIKLLLEEMGYSNVKVTSPSNDKGVDVEADVELGISHVHEVIQVKRQKSSVGQPILNQLRGSLVLFNAVRGTIITTGGFTKGAKDVAFLKGAAPITLIDGETLVSLLIEHDIGIRRREIRILEFDPESLSEFEEDTALPASGQLE